MAKDRIPTHPGEILLHEFLEPLELDAGRLASHIGVEENALHDVVAGKAPVDVRLAWLLSMALGTTPQFWMNLQSAHSLAAERPTVVVPPAPGVHVEE